MENIRNPNTKKYLSTNNRPELNENCFKPNHYIYRIGKGRNPIDLGYPESTITALSCNWSKLVIPSDLLLCKSHLGLGEYLFYIPIQKLKQFEVVKNDFGENEYHGNHKLTCTLYHVPIDEDYSHVQVDIHHVIIKDDVLFFERRYTHKMWKDKSFTIIRKGILKELRDSYMFELAKAFEELPPCNQGFPRLEFITYYPNLSIRLITGIIHLVRCVFRLS